MRDRLVALALLAAGCAGAPAAVKTTSAPHPPAWMTRTPSDPDTLYFTGATEGATALEDGKTAALESARSQAAEYIGVEISAQHTDVMSTEEAENRARDTVKSRATAVVRSAELADVYYEKISRQVGEGTIDRFDVWVLIRLPRAEIEKERQRQKTEEAEAVQAALLRYRDGQAQAQAGNLLAALARYRDALKQLQGKTQGTPTGDAQIPTAARLQEVVQDATASAQGKVRRAIVLAPDWVAGALTQALSGKGFTARTQSGGSEDAALALARAQGMPWVIVVHASTAQGGRLFAQSAVVAATAALDVRALDARSGAVVASAQRTEKGFGRTPQAAQDDAASKAGLDAGNDLAAALLAKENTGL